MASHLQKSTYTDTLEGKDPVKMQEISGTFFYRIGKLFVDKVVTFDENVTDRNAIAQPWISRAAEYKNQKAAT